jgi:two-component system, OmpR family, phosphate regulon sensor histidine kinase PhoR
MFNFISKKTDELEKESARLEASINSINVGYIITDETGEIKIINNTAKVIFCTEKTSFSTDPKLATLQCTMADVTSQLQGKLDLKTIVLKVLSDKKPFSVRNLQLKKLFLNITITPVVLLKKQNDINLEFIGAVILIEDVTQQKVLERSRSDFFSIASHELKTPLAVIKGNVELIKRYYPQKEDRLNRILDDMYESSIRLIDIVNDFLDISHLEQGKIEFKKESFNLTQLIDVVIKSLSTLAEQKGLFIRFITVNRLYPLISRKFIKERGDLGVFCLADKYRTQQVIINLLDNALKFTEAGGVTIYLQEKETEVKIKVEDTGLGIPLENQHLVFNKFELASNDTLTRGANRNTGVGLYISKYLAEGMGGQLKLDYSEEGKGSVFSLSLPK